MNGITDERFSQIMMFIYVSIEHFIEMGLPILYRPEGRYQVTDEGRKMVEEWEAKGQQPTEEEIIIVTNMMIDSGDLIPTKYAKNSEAFARALDKYARTHPEMMKGAK